MGSSFWEVAQSVGTPAVRSLSSGGEYSPVRTLQGNTETRSGENSLRTWKTDTERKETTRVITIWQRTTETPARYRQCRRATPVTVLITSSGARSLGQRWQAPRAVHTHRQTQNEHTDPWTVTHCLFSVIRHSLIYLMISYEAFSWTLYLAESCFIVREL